MSDQVQQLQMRIVELENQLKHMQAAREPQDISAEELKTYRKVKSALYADLGVYDCGVNDCDPCVIAACRRVAGPIVLCRPCDVECYCGPCNVCAMTRLISGGGRFSSLGG